MKKHPSPLFRRAPRAVLLLPLVLLVGIAIWELLSGREPVWTGLILQTLIFFTLIVYARDTKKMAVAAVQQVELASEDYTRRRSPCISWALENPASDPLRFRPCVINHGDGPVHLRISVTPRFEPGPSWPWDGSDVYLLEPRSTLRPQTDFDLSDPDRHPMLANLPESGLDIVVHVDAWDASYPAARTGWTRRYRLHRQGRHFELRRDDVVVSQDAPIYKRAPSSG